MHPAVRRLRRRRPPTLAERLLGRRRARRLRRRLGYLALGSGVGLLKPALVRGAAVAGAIVAVTGATALYL